MRPRVGFLIEPQPDHKEAPVFRRLAAFPDSRPFVGSDSRIRPLLHRTRNRRDAYRLPGAAEEKDRPFESQSVGRTMGSPRSCKSLKG